MASTGQIFHKDAKIEKNQVNVHNYAPKQLPPHLYLFPSSSIYFHGREDKFSEIDQAVAECKFEAHAFLRTIVIQGFGGMGKSETARAYAQRNHKKYDYIVWLDAQTETILNTSFKYLAKNLDVGFETIDDIGNIYRKLSSTYHNGMFIFDNAERLKTENDHFGIEEYINPDFFDKKLINVVSSRNARAWGGMQSQIKIINLDRLSPPETLHCVRKYLHVENQEIPATLQVAISSISTKLQGYPLALSLVCGRLDQLAEEISFDQIESRIKGYIEVLDDMPIKEVYDESVYEKRLELILEETVKNLMANKNGCTALELLKIMSHFSPDGITLRLMYAIVSCKCYDGEEHFEIKDQDFRNAFKLLQSFSLVRIEKEGNVRIHRFIQESALKLATKESITTILGFFERNPGNFEWIGHMTNIYNALIDGASADKRTHFLSLLAWKLQREQSLCHKIPLILDKLKEHLTNGTKDEQFILKLVEMFEGPDFEKQIKVYTFSELLIGMTSLSKEFLSHTWVLECLIQVVDTIGPYFHAELNYEENLIMLEHLRDLIVDNCTHNCPTTETICCEEILRFLYGPWSSRCVKGDAEFLLTLIGCLDRRSRLTFWKDALRLSTEGNGRNFLVDLISACGLEIFMRSLQAGNQRGESMSLFFLDSVIVILMHEETSHKLVESTELLIELSEAWKWLNYKFASPHMIFIWVCLFVQNMDIYTTFKGTFQRELEKNVMFGILVFYTYMEEVEKKDALNKLSVFRESLKKFGHETKLADLLCSSFEDYYE